jgi:DNA-binding transcriptional ArsR family regulator
LSRRLDIFPFVSIFFLNIEIKQIFRHNVYMFEPINDTEVYMGDKAEPECQSAQILLQQVRDACKILTAIGDESRQLILAVLTEGKCDGMRVGEITERTHLSRPAISHHLKILLDAEVIGMTREGTKHFYYLKFGGAWPTLVELINNIENLRNTKCWEDS